jgi:hypothetical protein
MNSEGSLLRLVQCRTIAEPSMRLNALLPRIVRCLYRHGALSEADFTAWNHRFHANGVLQDTTCGDLKDRCGNAVASVTSRHRLL